KGGASRPPVRTTPASVQRSHALSGRPVAGRLRQKRRTRPRNIPAPRYRMPARNSGETTSSSRFASGALSPNASAAISALRIAMTTRHFTRPCPLQAVAGLGPRRPRGASDKVPLMTSLTARPTAPVRAPRGTELSCKGWPQEAALRMLMNNLDPDVAERWEDLVVYGGSGKAARSWEAYHTIVRTLRRLGGDETLLVQSGKPVG